MKNAVLGILVLSSLLGISSCQDCSIVEDSGNPARLFKLVDDQGNDLWFGATARYDPAEANFVHETEGVLPVTVNQSLKAVSVVIPIADDPEETITLSLDSATTENIRYATLVYDEECTMMYELSYVFQNDEKVCSSCGNSNFNKDRFIYLKK